MTTRMTGALRRRLAGSALGGLIAFAAVPVATAQWLPPWAATASSAQIEQRLEARGYVLVAPVQHRPGIYLADVRGGPAAFQRLVIDDRSGDIIERFIGPPRGAGPAFAVRFLAPPRSFGPEYALRFNGFGEPPPPGFVEAPPGPGFSGVPNGGPAAKSAEGGPANVRIPSAVSPFGSQLAPAMAKPKPKSAATDRKSPSAKTAPGALPPTAAPPLPPPAPREAVKPDESAPPAPKLEPKGDSPPGENENASTTNAPATPEAANVEPQLEAQTQPATATQSLGRPPEPAAAPASSAEASDKSKISIVPATLFE
jgi:hypothetical protein